AGRAQLHDALKYGMIAKSAYLDKEDEKLFSISCEGTLSRYQLLMMSFDLAAGHHSHIRVAPGHALLWACAHSVLQVRAKLQAFRGGEVGNAPFKIVKHTGTLWKTPLTGRHVATDTEAHIGDMEGVPAGRHPKNVKVHRGFLTSFNDVVHPTESGSYDAMSDVRDELMGKGVLPARVGNREFAEAFASTVDRCYRVTHKNDVVPAVPASPLWVHVSQGVLLLEPARNTYGHAVPKAMPPGTRYRAVLGDRPRPGAYASELSTGSWELPLQQAELSLYSILQRQRTCLTWYKCNISIEAEAQNIAKSMVIAAPRIDALLLVDKTEGVVWRGFPVVVFQQCVNLKPSKTTSELYLIQGSPQHTCVHIKTTAT
ncbi:hypothetical protein COO60DRAFT_1466416, partial [Scenedesmus sp. NREL 46B-D3]